MQLTRTASNYKNYGLNSKYLLSFCELASNCPYLALSAGENALPSNTGGPGEQHAQEQNQRPEQG